MFIPLDPVTHRDADTLVQGMPHIGAAPTERGSLERLVRRPGLDEREVLQFGELSVTDGWSAPPGPSVPAAGCPTAAPTPTCS